MKCNPREDMPMPLAPNKTMETADVQSETPSKDGL